MANERMNQTGDDRNVQLREETRASEKYLKPAVNILEMEEGLKLMADMPGADKGTLNVNMEKGILTISAEVKRQSRGKQFYTEFELAPYYRQFQIPESLDHEKTSATFNNGVLTLRIAKAEIAKPRRIEIKVAGS